MVLKNQFLQVKNLQTFFKLDEGILKAVNNTSFEIGDKETLGLIGESGCGKSVTAQSIMRIVPKPGRIVSGEVLIRKENGKYTNLTDLSPFGKEIRKIRGKKISMIFQEPMTSLSPVHTIGFQIMEAILLHKTKDKSEAKERALDMLNRVGIHDPDQLIKAYPHELSGGLRQRAMIAMALSCDPSLLIADEPTTALDVTVQAQILDLMLHLKDKYGMSILYITHNLGVIAEVAQKVAVMYMGRIVEYAGVIDIFKNTQHPYTKGLLKSIPRLGNKSGSSLDAIKGTVPVPLNPPRECGFYSRCPAAKKGLCNKEIPALVDIAGGHLVRCFLYSEKREEYDEA